MCSQTIESAFAQSAKDNDRCSHGLEDGSTAKQVPADAERRYAEALQDAI